MSILAIKILAGFAIGALLGWLYRVFGRPRKIEYKPLAISKFVEIDGFDIHFIQEGRGPDLLLIHGIGASVICWRQIWRLLTKHYRVTAIDLPGFGQSTKKIEAQYDLDSQTQRVAQFLEALDIKKTYVIGSSLGGAVSMWLARTRPDLVSRLVAIAPAVNHRLIRLDPNRWWAFVHVFKHFAATPLLVRMIHSRASAKHKDTSLETILEYYAPYHKNPTAAVTFWKSLELIRDRRLPDELKHIECPTLIMYGEWDQMIKKDFISNLPEIVPGARVVYHETGGHHLMTDEPEFVADEIKKFLGTPQLKVVD